MRALPTLLALISLPATLTCAWAAGLNDTGQIQCYDASGNPVACSVSGDDARYGRDAAAQAGKLTKTGAGVAGFDYTKVCNSGELAGQGACPASPALGSAATDWGCTQDNVTGLIWEVKTTDNGLRDKGWTYTWYSTDDASNGYNGVDNQATARGGGVGANTCGGTLSGYANQCNTANYVAAVNALTGASRLCGATDWRMPALKEMQGLVDFAVPATGANPIIDSTYFPNTVIRWYWTATNYAADPASAWNVGFDDGVSNAHDKPNGGRVRLVRGGQ